MKKLVLKLFVSGICISVTVLAQQQVPPCSGPAPEPARAIEGGAGPSVLEAWMDAIERWAPCTNQAMTPSGVISARALGRIPGKAAQKEFNRGMGAVNKGLNTEALEYFEKAVRLDPSYVQPYVQSGIVRAKADQPLLALQSFLTALALEPDADFLQFNVAYTLFMLRRPSEAEVFARRVARRSPWFADAQYVLGVALVMQGKLIPEAVAALRVAGVQHTEAREMLVWVEGKLSAAGVCAP
jgi:tetratricopeptide (TPR) repeat protein